MAGNGRLVAALFLLAVVSVQALNLVLENSRSQFVLSPATNSLSGYLYPKDSTGQIYGWYEENTLRSIVPQGAGDLILYNPSPTSLFVEWNYTTPYSLAHGIDTFNMYETGVNTTILGHTLIGQGGLKIGAQITSDSNIYNASTTKTYFVTLQTSHPILSLNRTLYPTPYQQNLFLRSLQTAFFSASYNSPTFAESDGVETVTTLVEWNRTYTASGQLEAITLVGTASWLQDWIWDPELSILLTDNSFGGSDGGGDGGSDDKYLALISLVVLIVAPVVVVVVVGVVGVAMWRRRTHQMRRFTDASVRMESQSDAT